MKKSSSDSHVKPLRLEIFYSQVADKDVRRIQKKLVATYEDVLDVSLTKELELTAMAYNSQRGQYNAGFLLDHLHKIKKRDVALWVIKEDLFCHGMNFIFGLAQYGRGAVLSIFRLSSSKLIEKEAIHEVGHVLGLKHCKNHCIMQYSNSLFEARMKPSDLCDDCKRKISKF